MKVRLTKAQREWLEQLADGPKDCHCDYKPANNLEAKHRFSTSKPYGFARRRHWITDAGKQWLAENAK